MAITYNAPSNTIQIVGYTEGTPCNFTDIYNADVAGSWGVVTRQCTDQFCLTCGLVIGDGSTVTWFADTSKHLLFTSATPVEIVEVKANGNFRLGEIVSGKRTKNGCCVHTQKTSSTHIRADHQTTGTGKIEIYSSHLSSAASTGLFLIYATSPKVYNCVLSKNTYFNLCSGVDYYNIIIQNVYAGFRGSSGTFDKIHITDSGTTYGIVFAGAEGFTMKNLYARNNSAVFYAFAGFTVNDAYVINWDVDNWTFHWDAAATKKLYRQYEFDLKVIDKDNTPINAATVKVWDKDSNLIVDTTTNASGIIATQTITRGYYNEANGNTLQEASPHLIKIEKAGYTTYEADFTLDDKTDWLIALQAGGGLLRNPPMTGGMV